MSYVTYKIVDPRDGVPVYIGQSIHYEIRKKSHLKKAKGNLPTRNTFNIVVYLVLLESENIEPIFEILEITQTEEESLASETRWVKKTVELGYPLLNKWNCHKEIINSKFTSTELKKYFCERFSSEEVSKYA